MGRVLGFLDVRTSIKIAVTVAVALLAFGTMASPAWAQETTLTVDKTADTDPVTVGNVLTYTIVVTNTGANAAENVTLSDVMDYGTVDVNPDTLTVSTTQGSCLPLSGTFVSCTLGSLGVGESATVTVQLKPTSLGTITNTAVAGADNAAGVEDAVTTAVVPDLVIDKLAPADFPIGAPFTYTLRVTNQGETNADNVIVTDALPLFDPHRFREGVYLDRFTSDKLTCEEDANTAGLIRCEGSLAAGETATVEIFVRTGPIEGTITNTAKVRVEGVPALISSDTVTTQTFPGIEEPGDPGDEPGNDKEEWVLVDHKGKELCLPEAALKGHERHGDEVINEEGCSSDTEQPPRDSHISISWRGGLNTKLEIADYDPSCTYHVQIEWGDGDVTRISGAYDGFPLSHNYGENDSGQAATWTIDVTGTGSSSDPNVACTFTPYHIYVLQGYIPPVAQTPPGAGGAHGSKKG